MPSPLKGALERAWRDGGALSVLLAPLAVLFGVVSERRAAAYRDGRLAVVPSALPVVVIGNLNVGGSGKTPLTAHLVAAFRARGWTPGIVSRGHGGERREEARLVTDADAATSVGDEPLMLHRSTGAPVCVCVYRARAVAKLAAETDCDVVLSDDGLQHGAMERDAEIVVVDAAYGFGNGRLLPSGPLRERPERLYRATLLAVRRERVPERRAGEVTIGRDPGGIGKPDEGDAASGLGPLEHVPGAQALDGARLPPAFDFATAGARVRHWPDGQWRSLGELVEGPVHAVAGIARPERFFALLRCHGLSVEEHAFPDHHSFRSPDLRFGDARPVLVTSKDAVKLDALEGLPDGIHEVAVDILTEPPFDALIDALAGELARGRRHR